MQRPQQDPGSSSTPPPDPSRGAPPLLSPAYSRSLFPAAACAAVGSEQPSITLDEWWLARVEGHERKIAVAGLFERNQEIREFTSAPISKRYEPLTLETEDGIVVFIFGFFNPERTLQNGYTIEACKKFCIGFPHWWEDWNVLYPKMMSLQTGSQQTSVISNSHEDSNVLSASMVDCTNGKSKVAINNASRINKGREKTHVASLHDKALPGEATDEQYSEKEKKSVGPSRKQSSAFGKLQRATRSSNIKSPIEYGKKPVGPSRKQSSAFGKLQHATRSSNVKSPIAYDNRSPHTRGMSKPLSVFTPEYLHLKKTRSGRVVVPKLDSGRQKIVYDQDGSISAIVGLDLPPPLKGSKSKNYAKKRQRSN